MQKVNDIGKTERLYNRKESDAPLTTYAFGVEVAFPHRKMFDDYRGEHQDLHEEAYELVYGDKDFEEYAYPTKRFGYRDKWLVNHTKECAVKLPQPKPRKLVIHPLAILTSVGAGYSDELPVGTWAYDTISIEKEVPEGFEILDIEFGETDW